MDYNLGHRERIRERLIKSKPGVMEDYEVMELLLCLALPRRDTKALAKELIDKFGSFAKAISAEDGSLLAIKGLGATGLAAFRLIKEGAARLIREEVSNKPILSSWQSLLNYCRVLMGHAKREMFLVLYLNSQNALMDEEDLQDYGTIDQVSVYPREIAKRALQLNASAVILENNHPGGSTKASKADIEMTKQIVKTLDIFKIKLHDHVIVSDKSFFSFKTEGLL